VAGQVVEVPRVAEQLDELAGLVWHEERAGADLEFELEAGETAVRLGCHGLSRLARKSRQ
jgi:hypothetical protein